MTSGSTHDGIPGNRRGVLALLLLAGLMLGLLSTGCATGSSGAGLRSASGSPVVETISRAQIMDILRQKGGDVEAVGERSVRWTVADVKALVSLSPRGNTITYRVAFTNNGSVTIDKVNTWNESKSYSRSYLDSDGDPVLELDIDLEGGVTLARIDDFFQTCLISLRAWVEEVL